jgi:DMSO/TMAO reductase YedYZ molybdopterin-dependent catalytic subunit
MILRNVLLSAICAALVCAQPPAPAQIKVTGDIASPLTLTADDLAKMPRDTVTIPDPSGNKIVYEGVQLRELLHKAGTPEGKDLRRKALTTYVLAKARDGYAVVFTLGEVSPEFGNQSILVADKRDGKPLPGNQGPFRLVCPNDKEGARSVRMLEAIEVVRLNK